MCEQCLANAVAVAEGILPGFTLMQATAGTEHWPAGWYGLVQINGPDVVFPGPLVADPGDGDFDEATDTFLAAGAALGRRLNLPAILGYQLVQACVTSGYRPDTDGHLEYWLMNHLARAVKALPA